MPVVRGVGGAALLSVAASVGALAAGAAPELPVAEWTGTEVSLEDLRGQLVAVVFK